MKAGRMEKSEVRVQKPNSFDRYPKRGTLSEMKSLRLQKIKARKFKSIKCLWLLGH